MKEIQVYNAEYRREHWPLATYAETLKQLDDLALEWRAIQSDLRSRATALEAKYPKTRFDNDALDDIAEDLKHCDSGLHSLDGSRDARIAALRGRPGLDRINELRATLRQELNARRAEGIERTVWPRPFRYIGEKEQFILDGRPVKPGEIVQLDEAKATSFSDLFIDVRLLTDGSNAAAEAVADTAS